MKRISPELKAIADRHIEARQNNTFQPLTHEQEGRIAEADDAKPVVLQMMKDGVLFEQFYKRLEARYASITSSVLNGVFGHSSHAYKAAIYKGFREQFS